MAVPKKRKSKSKTRSRRSANMKLKSPQFQFCPHCAAPKQPHRVCPECGHYGPAGDGEQIVEVWEY